MEDYLVAAGLEGAALRLGDGEVRAGADLARAGRGGARDAPPAAAIALALPQGARSSRRRSPAR